MFARHAAGQGQNAIRMGVEVDSLGAKVGAALSLRTRGKWEKVSEGVDGKRME
jgi:hypothetical protein